MEIAQLRGRLGATPLSARSYPMLRLVHPVTKGQVSSRPKERWSQALPTHEEQQRIRAAIRNTARAYGGYDVPAAVVGLPNSSLQALCKPKLFALAVLLACAAGIPVEQVLTGKPHEAGSCALCGRKGRDDVDVYRSATHSQWFYRYATDEPPDLASRCPTACLEAREVLRHVFADPTIASVLLTGLDGLEVPTPRSTHAERVTRARRWARELLAEHAREPRQPVPPAPWKRKGKR